MRGLSVSNTVLLIICLMYLILFVEIGAAQEPELRQRKTRNTTSTAVRLRAQSRPPGTEFLDAETGRPKPSLKCVSARGDQNPGNE
jgi:hypothetical protein